MIRRVLAFVVLSAGVSLGDTVRFDITDLDLSIFGVQYTADYLGPGDGFVTGVSAHLVYQSGTFAAENIRLQFEAPVGDGVPAYPLWDLTGAALGWTGTGTFTADPTTTALNGRILDGQAPPGSMSLWFFRIINDAGTLPIGGRFVGSYFDVEYTPIPAPGIAGTTVAAALLAVRRRRRGPVGATASPRLWRSEHL